MKICGNVIKIGASAGNLRLNFIDMKGRQVLELGGKAKLVFKIQDKLGPGMYLIKFGGRNRQALKSFIAVKSVSH